MAALSIDGIRRSDLSVGGWAAAGIAAASLGYGVVSAVGGDFETLAVGGILAVFFVLGAYETAKPEVDGTCDNCGEHVRVHSGRDGVDEVVHIRTTGTPRRIDVGPVSAVVSRRRREHIYCSESCAGCDIRIVPASPDDQTTDANPSRYEVTD